MRFAILIVTAAALMFAMPGDRNSLADPPVEADRNERLIEILREKQRAFRQVRRGKPDAVDPIPLRIDEAERRRLVRSIDPQGICGALVLAGQTVPMESVSTFLELAHGKKAQVVVLQIGKAAAGLAELQRLLDRWQRSESADMHWFGINSAKDANSNKVVSAVKKASGVWILAANMPEVFEILSNSPLLAEIRNLPGRGAVVGGSAAVTAMMPSSCLHDGGPGPPVPGLGLLTTEIIDTSATQLSKPMVDELEHHPFHVGFEIHGESALVISGRRMKAEGDGRITISLPASDSRPAFRQVMQDGHRLADLTALRKMAVNRLGPAFPPAKPDPPCVKTGTLIIIGGGGIPDGLLKRFVQAAGGEKARIVVLPTAMPDPLPEKSSIADALRREGAGHVAVLRGRTLAEVESDAFLDELRNATGIWFGGGRQWRFADAYLDTKAHALMHDVLRRGGAIAGSSAGASIQAEYMARGNPLGNLDVMVEGYERGLGFLSGVAIDQHFTQRGRQRDMTQLVDTYPQLLGIGIDESTAIVVTGSVAEVVGKNLVCFYDRNKPEKEGEADFETVRPGGRYELKSRKVLDPGVEAKPLSPKR